MFIFNIVHSNIMKKRIKSHHILNRLLSLGNSNIITCEAADDMNFSIALVPIQSSNKFHNNIFLFYRNIKI